MRKTSNMYSSSANAPYPVYPLKDIFDNDKIPSDVYVKIAYNGFISPLSACLLENDKVLVKSDASIVLAVNYFTFQEFKSIVSKHGSMESNIFFQNSHYNIFWFKECEVQRQPDQIILRVGARR